MSDMTGPSTLAQDLVRELLRIEAEVDLLKEERKAVLEDYKEKLDLKAFNAAVRIVRTKKRLGASQDECERIIYEIDGIA